MPVGGGKSEVLAYLYGGQGTINVPSWSPDARRIAASVHERFGVALEPEPRIIGAVFDAAA